MHSTYVYRHRVTFDETNLVGNVYFAQYLHWQGHCREHFLADHAPGVAAALGGGPGDGLALVTVSCGAEFYAECAALDSVEVHMSLRRVAENRIEMSFDYLRTGRTGGDGAAATGPELLARGHQTVASMRRTGAGLRPVPVPGELVAALARYAPAPAAGGLG